MTIRNCGGQYKTLCVWPVLVFGIPLYLYVNLFAFPNIPFLLGGDQVFFWVYAQRMLSGERVYQDFFQFTPPGTDLFYLALFKLFGPHIWVTNVAVLLLGTALCWICFSIAKRLMEQNLALLAAVLFLVFVYCRLLNATHHWFSLLAALCAVRIVMPGRTGLRIAIAGTMLGVASFFTQTAGVAGLLALLLSLAWDRSSAKESWRTLFFHQVILVAAFCVTLTALNTPLIAKVGWRQLWYFQVFFPRHYLTYWFGKWFPGLPEPLAWITLPRLAPYLFVYALLPVIYPSILWHCWRNRRNPAFRCGTDLVLLAFLGLFLLLEILPGVNWLRLYSISMPGFILLVYAADCAPKLRHCVSAAGWIIVLCLAIGNTWLRYHQIQTVAALPAGKVILSAQKYEKFSWLAQHTTPGDLFFQAAWHDTYIPLDLRNPVFLDVLVANEESRPEYLELIVRQLERKQVKYILWSPLLNDPNDFSRPWEDHLGPFRAYLRNRYTLVRVFSDRDEVWQRN
jgi:hypothetical protein